MGWILIYKDDPAFVFRNHDENLNGNYTILNFLLMCIQYILANKDVTSILSVVCWDVSPRKDDITLVQVLQ